MTIVTYIILYIVGVVAGIINVVAGGGGVLTLPALMFFGDMSSHVANATNRIGILVQNPVGLARFRKGGIKEDRISLWLAGIGVVGALVGANFLSYIP